MELHTGTDRYLVPRRRPGPEWTFLGAEGGSKHSKSDSWHHAGGWFVHHCGHPSAHWPWYLVEIAAPDTSVMSWNGRGFHSVYVARFAVEGILSGELVASSDRCAPGVRRVLSARVR